MQSVAVTQFVILLVVYTSDTSAFPSGAPTSTCTSMMPNVYSHQASAQTSPPPYWLTVSNESPNSGDTLTVTVKGSSQSKIRGILLQARYVESSSALGEFLDLENVEDFKGLDCSGANSAVTHVNRDDKPLPLTFTWRAPAELNGDLEFTATIVETKSVFWMNIMSDTLTPPSPCSPVQEHTAAVCVNFWQAAIYGDTSDLRGDSLDIITFCRELEKHRDSFTACTYGLGEGCEYKMAPFLELYKNTSHQYCDCDVPHNCLANPCYFAMPPNCPEGRRATCISRYCGGCWAAWVDQYNNPIQCSAGNTTSNSTTNTTIPVVYPPNQGGFCGTCVELLFGLGLLWISLWILV